MKEQVGFFVISLDFELLWGVQDLSICEEYKSNVCEGRKAVVEILKIFEEYGIHATWATVGIMLHDSKEELLGSQPINKPSYENSLCSAYNHLHEIGNEESDDIYHYGGSLIQMIINTSNQEIGSHTYSHYYCMENGADIKSFEEDVVKSKEILREKYGIDVKSMVFPRNQYTAENIQILKKCGFTAYRGNPQFGFDSTKRGLRKIIQKVVRFIDAFIPLSGWATYAPDCEKCITNVAASAFLRPDTGVGLLEKLKIRRIKGQMLHAAKKGEMFHLWWHPHNFGKNTDRMLSELKEILSYYTELADRYSLKSVTMQEYAEFCQRQ